MGSSFDFAMTNIFFSAHVCCHRSLGFWQETGRLLDSGQHLQAFRGCSSTCYYSSPLWCRWSVEMKWINATKTQFRHLSAANVRLWVRDLIALGRFQAWIKVNSETLLHVDSACKRQAGGAYSSAVPVSFPGFYWTECRRFQCHLLNGAWNKWENSARAHMFKKTQFHLWPWHILLRIFRNWVMLMWVK